MDMETIEKFERIQRNAINSLIAAGFTVQEAVEAVII